MNFINTKVSLSKYVCANICLAEQPSALFKSGTSSLTLKSLIPKRVFAAVDAKSLQ